MIQSIPTLSEMCDRPPRVLNLHRGQPGQNSLAAVNIKVSPASAGSATTAYDNGHFVIVRTAGIIDNLLPNEILLLFREWKRILHRFGMLYLDIPVAQTDSVTSLLRKTGFSTVKPLRSDKDLPAVSGVNIVTNNRLTLTAARKKLRHNQGGKLSQKSFEARCKNFTRKHQSPDASFVIPVHNEAAHLPKFLQSLSSCTNLTSTRREYIFVLNGCTDESEDIVRNFIQSSRLDCRIISSDKGILKALLTGIAARNLDGFIGKLDADVIVDPQSLDLLQMHLVTHKEVMAAYAEPVPRGPSNKFNAVYFQPSEVSRRLFYIGQTCLLRSVPFDRPAIIPMLQQLRVGDMFLSAYFAYFYGLESIAQVSNARIYFKPFNTMEDLIRVVSRSHSESLRIAAAYPPFTILGRVFEREFYPPEFKKLYKTALNNVRMVDDWTRITSTKE